MPTTFQETYETVMGLVSRPTSETAVLTMAKREINNALLFLQRHHSFAFAETLDEATYTANAQSISLTGLRSILSVQQLSASGNFEGLPLKVFSYSQLQANRLRYYKQMPAGHEATFDTLTDLTSIFALEEGYRRDRIAFIVANKLGLYPRVGVETRLMVHANYFLSALSANSDTNFLLDYAFDVVVKLAVRGMNPYLKLDGRFAMSDAEVAVLLDALVRWDNQVRESPMSTV